MVEKSSVIITRISWVVIIILSGSCLDFNCQ